MVLGECEATDFTQIWFLTMPLLWFLSWNGLLKARWLCGLFLLAARVTDPGTPDGDGVAVLQHRWVQLVWFFTICKGTGEKQREHAQNAGDAAELTEPPSICTGFSLDSETAGAQFTFYSREHSDSKELKLRALDFIINRTVQHCIPIKWCFFFSSLLILPPRLESTLLHCRPVCPELRRSSRKLHHS